MSSAPDLSDFSKEEIIEELNKIRHPVEVAVLGSKNEFNFGGIIRTCHCFLTKKIWAVDMPWFYKKGAMGTLKYEKSNMEFLSQEVFLAKAHDRNIVAFERRPGMATEDIRFFKYPENPIFVFGNEQIGQPQEILDAAQSVVSIPVYGITNDLNIATAVGIALHDFTTKLLLERYNGTT